MRGEHIKVTVERMNGGGSSPHARGTRSHPTRQRCARRLIPACAGNTATPASAGAPSPAHPRMRGEHENKIDGVVASIGASPHARGTPMTARDAAQVARLIPACAGNTEPEPIRSKAASAHPRMRGEHGRLRIRRHEPAGSSPHARGTPPVVLAVLDQERLIPACAGNTHNQTAACPRPAAHPRMRGEHSVGSGRRGSGSGSSPHARGTPGTSP